MENYDLPEDEDILTAMDIMRSMGWEPASLPEIKQAIAEAMKNIASKQVDSDPDVPTEIWTMVALAEVAAELTIKAVTRHTTKSFAPDGDVDNLSAWHLRRLTDGLLPTDPPAKTVTRSGWLLHTEIGDNPVRLESWFRRQDYDAQAVGPTECFVVTD